MDKPLTTTFRINMTKYRVVKVGDVYHIQTRWTFWPFWSYHADDYDNAYEYTYDEAMSLVLSWWKKDNAAHAKRHKKAVVYSI